MSIPEPAYFRPQSPAEAVQILAENPGAFVVGGGTLAMGRIFPFRPRAVLDLSGAGLDGIVALPDGSIQVGAGASPALIAAHPIVQGPAMKAFRRAAVRFEVGSVRRVATLGGNLCTGVGSMVTGLVLLGAHALSLGPEGMRHHGLAPSDRRPAEILVAVEIPAQPDDLWTDYTDLRRTPISPAIVSVALGVADGLLRVAIGGAEVPHRRLMEIEGPLETHDAGGWGQAVARALRPIEDARASAAYRRAMAAVLTERLVRRLDAGDA